MSDIKKFLFDLNDFDEVSIDKALEGEKEESPPPAPTFSEEELEAVRAEAYQKGRIDGIDEERANIHQQIQDTLAIFPEMLQSLLNAEAERTTRFTNDSIAMSLDALRKAFPHIYDQAHSHALKTYLHDIINDQIEQSRLVIFVNETLHKDIETYIKDIIPEDQKALITISVKSKEDIPVGHAHIQWEYGGSLWTPLNLQDHILKVFEAHMPNDYAPETIESRMAEDAAAAANQANAEITTESSALPSDISTQEAIAPSPAPSIENDTLDDEANNIAEKTEKIETPMDEALKKEHNKDNKLQKAKAEPAKDAITEPTKKTTQAPSKPSAKDIKKKDD